MATSTVSAHGSHGGHLGPSLPNNPTLDKAARELINIKPLGSQDWHGMCALHCQQTRTFISVEAMQQIGLPVEDGGQYKCEWMLNDGVERVGIFQAVSGLGADVAFGVNWLDDGPAPATAISIDTTPHSPRNPLAGLITAGHSSTPSRQLLIDGHPARSGSQDCGDIGHQKQRHQDAPISMGPYGGLVLWPFLGCLALGSFYLWQKTRATR
ncbi:unnamed protein product [Clonostachys rhizophaga]|uniref:Uncharacterized protein n=1 Tax=Clonostachys rhizophaga TaxID=160324 RepID=A0A9N9VFE9_9HYPO|nr:unnamed protein product [Clonostachys rhizophaga]